MSLYEFGQYGRIPAKFLRKNMRVRFVDGETAVIIDGPTQVTSRPDFYWVSLDSPDNDNEYQSMLVLKEDIPWEDMTLVERHSVDLQYFD